MLLLELELLLMEQRLRIR